MNDFTDDELKLLYDLLDEYVEHGMYKQKALDIQRKIEQHFGWDWNG